MSYDSSNSFAAVLIFSIGIFGVICNSLVVFAFKTDKASRTSFNLICLFRAIVNLYVLIITFLVCFLPPIITGKSVYPPYLEIGFIGVSLTLYLGNEYQTILVALNRFCALFSPFHYEKLFSFRPTLIALLLMYLFRFIYPFFEAAVYYKEQEETDVECLVFFSPEKLTWTSTDDPACQKEDNILLVVMVTFAIVLSLNVAIFTKIIVFQRSKNKEGKKISAAERKNILMFFQTVLQDSLYLIDLTFTFKLNALSDARFWNFVSGVLVWESVHALDGFIMLLFNERVSILRSLFLNKQSFPVSQTQPSEAMSVPNETVYNFHDPYNLLASSVMSVIGVIGVTCNVIMIYVFGKNPSERSSFNCICVTRAVSNTYVLVATFGMIFLPTSFLGYTPFFSLPLSSIIIANSFTFYALNDYLIVLIALNRFIAIYFPTRYSTICGMKPTIICIILIFTFHFSSLVKELYLYWTLGDRCWIYFSPYSLAWANVESPDCDQYDGLIQSVTIIFIITTFFNLLTLWKVRAFYLIKDSSASRLKEKKNIIMFFQTILQDFLFIIDLMFTFQFSGIINHRLWTFLSGTVIWQSIHAVDGFIMVMFNERLKTVLKTIRKNSVVIRVTSETTN